MMNLLEMAHLQTGLLFVDGKQGEMFQMDVTDYSLHAIPVINLRGPVAIDLDPEYGLIFWTDVVDRTIKRSSWNGDNQIVIKYLSSGVWYFLLKI